MQAWAPEEDQIILDMVQSEGPKWSKIVQMLPGRTVSSVRNRWQRIEKGRKLREMGVESKNRCHACGEPKRGHVCMAKMRNGGPMVEGSSVFGGYAGAGRPGQRMLPCRPPGPSTSPLEAAPVNGGNPYLQLNGMPMLPVLGAPGIAAEPPLRKTRSGSGSDLQHSQVPFANALPFAGEGFFGQARRSRHHTPR